MSDVSNPSHYNFAEIECIDAIAAALGKAGFVDFCRGNIIKYTWRAMHKGTPVRDMQKAVWYAKRAAEALEAQGFGDRSDPGSTDSN